MVVSERHTGTPDVLSTPVKCLQCISRRMKNVHEYTLGRGIENQIGADHCY